MTIKSVDINTGISDRMFDPDNVVHSGAMMPPMGMGGMEDDDYRY